MIRKGDFMKLIVGLGNPGKKYQKTRHNVGFMVLDYVSNFSEKKYQKKFDGLLLEEFVNNEKVVFFKPQLYMNLSGAPIKQVINYFKIAIEDVLIIYDDMDLELGKMKLKHGGNSGGHNGIKNIEEHLDQKEFKKLKIGLGRSQNLFDKDYVLGNFSKDEKKEITLSIEKASKIILDFISMDFDKLMNKYNGDI